MDRKSGQVGAPRSPARRRFLRRLLGTASALIAVGAYGHTIGANDLEVVRTRISVPSWPPHEPELRIGFLSDFHCDSDSAVNRAHRSVQMLMAESPDIVLLGGDFVTYDAAAWIDVMVAAIAPLSAAPLGAFGVLGNHDWWCHQPFQIAAGLNNVGIRILMNQAAPVPRHPGIWILGLDSATDHHDRVDLALNSTPPDAVVKILLLHEPDPADSMPAGFGLQLSGHSHGGQVRVFGRPIYTPPLAKIYQQGLMQARNHPIYVTRGIGMMGPPIRIDCPPEVSVITLGA